jgi:hypothetical protein
LAPYPAPGWTSTAPTTGAGTRGGTTAVVRAAAVPRPVPASPVGRARSADAGAPCPAAPSSSAPGRAGSPPRRCPEDRRAGARPGPERPPARPTRRSARQADAATRAAPAAGGARGNAAHRPRSTGTATSRSPKPSARSASRVRPAVGQRMRADRGGPARDRGPERAIHRRAGPGRRGDQRTGPSLAGHRHRPAARVQHGGRHRRVRDGPGRADRAAGANPGSPGRRRGTGHRRPAAAPVARRDGAAPAVPALRGGVQPSSGTSLAHEIPDASCLGTGRNSTSLPRMPPEQVLQRESVGVGGGGGRRRTSDHHSGPG